MAAHAGPGVSAVAPDSVSRLVVAMTGGIASGKTAASRHFETLGLRVHDADLIARHLVQPGQPALDEIVQVFGEDVLSAAGELDRPLLRQRVFADPHARRALEAILHPRVRTELREAVRRDLGTYSLLAIPLLLESGTQYDWIERVLVIDVPESVQLERLRQRDGISAELAQQMLHAQVSRAARLARADDVIENTGSLAALHRAVEQQHRRYLELASQRNAGGPI